MRKSREVPLTILTSIAIFGGIGCQQPTEVRNCVDANNHIVPDKNCQMSTPAGGGGGSAYRYVYGGASGEQVGDTVYNSKSAPEEGVEIISGEEAVSRGGFGHSSGEGEGGESGHGGGGE